MPSLFTIVVLAFAFVLALAISIVAYVQHSRQVSVTAQPESSHTQELGRVDEPIRTHVFYEAQNSAQAAHVRSAWDARIATMTQEDRLLIVPESRPGFVHATDVDPWILQARRLGLKPRQHILRIVHNHWRHDLDADAVALEFDSAADFATFQAATPARGPSPFNMRDALGAAEAVKLDTLLAMNRSRTAAERIAA